MATIREFRLPALVDVDPEQNLTNLIFDNAANRPHAVAFARKVGDAWLDVTTQQFLGEVVAVAKGLVAAGVEAGDRVALMSRTRYEWTVSDFAIWCAGAVTVPIYETSSAEQVRWMLRDAGVVLAIVEHAEHEALVQAVRADLPELRAVHQLDRDGLATLAAAGSQVPDEEIGTRRAGLSADSLATVIYTSGTTGSPKGCELTHGNFLFELGTAVRLLDDVFDGGPGEPASTLLFLPLAHVFARIVQIGAIMAGSKLGHTPDIKQLVGDLAEFRPTFILAVPRVFEKVYNSATARAHAGGGAKARIFDAAVHTAIAYSQATDDGRPGAALRARHALFDRLVYRKLRAALGGRTRYAISGGAPLGDRLGHFFRGIGVRVLEGYGLTETTAAATVNPYQRPRIGTVGRPLPGTAVRIGEDGEVLVHGPHVLRGYWHNPQASAAAIVDGWFHTGDLGELDPDGYLRITGRKKEIIVTAGGKNVAPAALEDRIRAHPLVSQCMVVGDQKPYVGALVTIDPEFFPAWRDTHGKPATASIEELTQDPDLRAEIRAVIDEANSAVSAAEAIKRFRILPVDFTEEGGQLTPSLKVKRSVVAKEFAAEIDALYA
ncbi:MAG: long-chain fatty acid--CoA ligase [Sporichthyaceae bacterium]|nr:long-chain fatty acid--CoA ligase [Sporichthyaceae bacterium]